MIVNAKNTILMTLLAVAPVFVQAEPITDKQQQPVIPITQSTASQSSILGTVWFESGSAITSAWSMPLLEALGGELSEGDGKSYQVLVEGHADSPGGQDENQILSKRRALHVKRYLVSVHNVDAARIHAIGLGEAALSGIQESASVVNRKVVVSVLKRGGQMELNPN